MKCFEELIFHKVLVIADAENKRYYSSTVAGI
jgi:hypothetical protein